MNTVKISAFSDGNHGGNPAGVVLSNPLPSVADMQRVAAEVGFSETVFAAMQGDENQWRVRYFSPESEVPFCGHATIALGALLAEEYGDNIYQLTLNNTEITVEGRWDGDQYSAALQSPLTHYKPLDKAQIAETLTLFGYTHTHLSDAIKPARIHGGADHYVFALKSQSDLARMQYELDEGRVFMQTHDLVTVMFVVAETGKLFHARNAFASGGVLEDPATGAAAAAFSGYLRDSDCLTNSAWKDKSNITIIQGADMGCRSIITAECGADTGSSIRVSGSTRRLD